MENIPITVEQKTTRKLVFSLTVETEYPVREKYVGSVIAQKPIKNVVIHNVLKVAWARYKTVSIKHLEENIIMIEIGKE